MNSKLLFIFLLLSGTFVACTGELDNDIDLTSLDCPILVNSTRLEEAEPSPCIYIEVWAYKGQFYNTCVCCVCDKISAVFDCDGEITKFDESKFRKNALYLFRVIPE